MKILVSKLSNPKIGKVALAESYKLSLYNIPKILTIILDCEGWRRDYDVVCDQTLASVSKRERIYCTKWQPILERRAAQLYPDWSRQEVLNTALHNIEYLKSVFTPVNTKYLVSADQLDSVCRVFNNFVSKEYTKHLMESIKPHLNEFMTRINLLGFGNTVNDSSGTIELFNCTRENPSFGDSYRASYHGSFLLLSRLCNNHGINYRIELLDEVLYRVPTIISNTDLEESWKEDIKSLGCLYPQGMRIRICENGQLDDFSRKVEDLLYSRTEQETGEMTCNTLQRYLRQTENSNPKAFEALKQASRCNAGYVCVDRCSSMNAIRP